MNRETLHQLIERIPEPELLAAQRYLEYLASHPAYRAVLSAPIDDEPVTQGDKDAIARAQRDIAEGRVVSHEEILREFGLQ